LLHHLLFVASLAQVDATRAALLRLNAQPLGEPGPLAEAWRLSHPLLGSLTLDVHLISDLDAITPHLRRNPVDLLIYDERAGGIEAQRALLKIRDDMRAFADLWGPDFLFPMSRVVAILEHEADEAHRAFALGRVQVRDVCIAPKNTAVVLRWIARILTRQGVVRSQRVGVALAGGGLEGFLYQVGVLHALHKGILGRPLRTVDAYSGVSSGSICAALMAGNVPTAEVIRAMHGKSDVIPSLSGSLLFDVAAVDIGKRIVKQSLGWAGVDPNKWAKKLLASVPTGLFKGEALKSYIKSCILAYGHDDTFAAMTPELYIGATDQDTFEHVTFGKPPWRDVPVSDALRASSALPPFFTPTQINGRWFIDGQVTKTVNLELLVERGCRLIVIVDPMKPHGTTVPGSVDKRGGVYAVIQTIKALVYTRFQAALSHLTERFPDVDFLVFQPDEECAHLMAGSPMRYRIRTRIVTAAYRQTLRQLRERHSVYAAKLSRFGFELRSPEELLELERREGDELESVA
jgi:predicted acylesterase/phospholipase RssA